MKLAPVYGLLACLSVSTAITPPRRPHQPTGSGSKILNFNETVLKPSFYPERLSVTWFAGREDGEVVYMSDHNALIRENFITGVNSTFVPAEQIPEDYHTYWIRPDQRKVLFAVNHTKQYRWSYFANYILLDVASGESVSLTEDQAGDIQYATFAPTGDAIAYVRGNDLFIYNNTKTIQVTNNGSPDMFNGVPDWVYEEEVFSDRFALWFSPDAQYLAFLSFNETGVPTYTIPYYTQHQPVPPTYPHELYLRYPKAGSTNPTVGFNLLDLNSMDVTTPKFSPFEPNNTIIGEVFWTSDDHEAVVYRAFNRVQDRDKHVKVEVATMKATVIGERDGTDGWLENTNAATYLGSINNSGEKYYVDMSDVSGWMHLYLVSADGGHNITLTSGQWEVTGIDKIDTARQLIYYTSTERHSTERHLYSISYKTLEKKSLVDDSVAGHYSASFSANAGYYILNYNGPDIPYQELYSTKSSQPIRTITDNAKLYEKLQTYNLPKITYFELSHPSGFTLNVMQRLPANFDPSKKYPIIFTPYGGPNSQSVDKSFQSLSWAAYIASDPDYEYISYTVDNRGTGFKGRAFRNVVTGQLGLHEAEDQIWAARELIRANKFVAGDVVAMWGWSFGGYLTSKVVEADSGVFTLGLITAPVTDWRFYDSVYTERYMKLPQTNAAGYETASVRRTAGFHHVAGGFVIFHGTGDDNVHYQNTATLVDKLVDDGLGPGQMDWFGFTDSDHGISYHGANPFLYKYMNVRVREDKFRAERNRLAAAAAAVDNNESVGSGSALRTQSRRKTKREDTEAGHKEEEREREEMMKRAGVVLDSY